MKNADTHIERFDSEKFINLAKTRFGIYRFVPMLTFSLDYLWGKGEIYAYHVTNLAIHIIAYLLCISFIYSLFCIPSIRVQSPQSRLFVALAVGSLWALHPVQTSAVTYLVQRMASLQGMFFLGATTAYVKARLALLNGERKRFISWGVVLGLAALGAFLSKENSAVLPLVILVIDTWFFDGRMVRRILQPLINCFQKRLGKVVLLACTVVVMLGTYFVMDHLSKGYSGRHFTMTERLLTESRVILRYVGAILIPRPGSLSLEHDVELSTSIFSPITTLLSMCAIGAALFYAVAARKRQPVITFGILWFFTTLSIESSIVPLELMFDHRMYLPSVGLVLAGFVALRQSLGRVGKHYSESEKKKLAWSLMAVVCSFLSLITFLRNEDWRDPVTIHADAVRKAPRNPRAHANYAVSLYLAGFHEEALVEAEKAIDLGRQNFEEDVVSAVTVVAVYMERKDWQKAIAEGEKLLAKSHGRADADSMVVFLLRLAECYRQIEDYSKAYMYAQKAIDVIRQYPYLRVERQHLYRVLVNLFADAEKKGVVLDNTLENDLCLDEKIAHALFAFGDWEGARYFAQKGTTDGVDAQHLVKTIDLLEQRTAAQKAQWEFDDASFLIKVAFFISKHLSHDVFMSLGERIIEHRLKKDPYDAAAHLLQGWYEFHRGRYGEAVSQAKLAIALAPQWAKAWIALGFFEQQAGGLEQALTAFQHTLELYPGYPKREVLKVLMAQLEASQMAGPESVISMRTETEEGQEGSFTY
ncbi:MAG: hypothetical protein WHS46_01805 [Desulfosoma sp.]